MTGHDGGTGGVVWGTNQRICQNPLCLAYIYNHGVPPTSSPLAFFCSFCGTGLVERPLLLWWGGK